MSTSPLRHLLSLLGRAWIGVGVWMAASSPLLGEAEALRTRVQIVGLTALSEEEVLAKLGGRLDFITAREPTRSRADDADFLVRRLLEKEGYSDVEISWRIPDEGDTIILTVNSGPRLTIGEVTVVGVEEETAETLQKYFTGSSLFGGEAEVPYLEEKVKEARRSTLSYLKSQGYWQATTKLEPPTIREQERKVDLTLQATPGLLHRIVALTTEGEIPPELANLPGQLQRYLERESTAATLREIQEGTATLLRDEGYQFASTSLSANHEQGETQLVLTIDSGQRYRLRQALVTGAKSTDHSRVQTLFQSYSGKAYDEERIARLRNSLLATGAFDSVNQKRIIDAPEQAIDVTLHLREGKPKGVSYYVGAGSQEGGIIGASYYDRNFLSKLYNLNIAAEASAIGFLGEVSVTDPFLFGRDLRATPRAFILSRTYDEYRQLSAGFGFTLAAELPPHHIFEVDAQLAYATVESEGLPEEALGATRYSLATIGATWLYDRRDSAVAPSAGLFARLRAELGAVAAETPNAFLRLDSQISYHYPIDETSRLGLNLQTGILAPTNQEELPVDLRYFLGGDDSVRSFPFRQLGPQAGGVARGGQSYWSANAEYLRKIAGPVYGVAFFDAGSLDESSANWPSFDPKLAAGLGFRLDLPIGPVRFEYGRALNPAEEDPSGAFHFAIGAAF